MRKRRRLTGGVAVAATVLAALVAWAGPATAASGAGMLETYGPGSTYTGPYHLVSLAAAEGTRASFHVRVVNIGSVPARFVLNSVYAGGGWNSFTSVMLYNGQEVPAGVTSSSAQPGPGWTTPVIQPAATLDLLYDMTADTGEPPGPAYAEIDLYTTDGALISHTTTVVAVQPPEPGTVLRVSSALQPWVGSPEFETAPSIQPTGTTRFHVRLGNPTARVTRLAPLLEDPQQCVSSFPVRVTLISGLIPTDVTSSWLAGTYRVTLFPRQHLDYLVTISAKAPYACGKASEAEIPGPGEGGYRVDSNGINTESVVLIANLAATVPNPVS